MPKQIMTTAAGSNTDLPLIQDLSMQYPMLDLPPDDGNASEASSISPCATSRDITESNPRASSTGEQLTILSTPSVLPTLHVIPPIFPNNDDASTVSARGFPFFLSDKCLVLTHLI
jgi:hypothetical protein